MKHKMLLLSAMLLGSAVSSSVLAQAASEPATRAEVKADTQRARSNGEIRKVDLERNPSASNTKPRATGDNQPATRADVKADANIARTRDDIPKGDTPLPASEQKQRSVSTKSRAEVKAEVPAPVPRAKVRSEYDPKDDPKIPKK